MKIDTLCKYVKRFLGIDQDVYIIHAGEENKRYRVLDVVHSNDLNFKPGLYIYIATSSPDSPKKDK